MEIIKTKFEELLKDSTTPFLVDFGATWCGPCQNLKRALPDIEKNYENKMQIFTVDIDDNYELAQKYGIRSVPTSIVFDNGKEKGRIPGYSDSTRYIQEVDSILEKA